MLEEFNSLVNGHFQHIVNALALVVDFESFTVVALALADFAWNINIGEEMHFYLDDTVALTSLAASALDIEGESSACVAVSTGVGSLGKKVTDIAEHACISSRIGAWSASDRGLVDADDLVKLVHTFHIFELAALCLCTVKLGGEVLVDYLVYQRGFA